MGQYEKTFGVRLKYSGGGEVFIIVNAGNDATEVFIAGLIFGEENEVEMRCEQVGAGDRFDTCVACPLDEADKTPQPVDFRQSQMRLVGGSGLRQQCLWRGGAAHL